MFLELKLIAHLVLERDSINLSAKFVENQIQSFVSFTYITLENAIKSMNDTMGEKGLFLSRPVFEMIPKFSYFEH